MTPCLDDNAVLELVSGTLGAAAHARAQEHLDACAACRALVADAAPAPGHDDEPAAATDWEHLQIGARLGRYQIVAVLGAGAMGFVFAAKDPELGRTVALKLLRAGGSDAAKLRPRLQREAQALAKLSHPNVVAVHDVGTFGEHLFVALEWVDGTTLATWLDGERRAVRDIVAAFRQAAEGLAAAHAAGLVHRDVKPDNILVGNDGRVRVTDFGLALQTGELDDTAPSDAAPDDLRLTGTNLVVGTPAYLAPEQIEGRELDGRGDQFAFCIALFEALYGRKPFAGDDWPALRTAVLAGAIDRRPRPGERRVPRWLARIVLRGLARDPAARYPTMRALLAALDRGPLVTPRRIAVAAGGAIVAAAIATIAIAGTQRDPPARDEAICAHAADAWAPVWTDATAAQLRARTAPEVAATVDRAFRAYGAAWSTAVRGSCVATRVDHTQPIAAFDVRDACLVDRRAYAQELARALLSGPPPRADGALEVASSLPAIDECANAQLLEAVVASPSSTARADLRARMARAQIRGYLRTDVDPESFQALADEAHALGLPALESRALFLRARYESDEQREETALQAAALAALTAHDDVALADAWGRLVFHTGFDVGRFRESEQWAAYAQAAIDRLGGDPVREAELLMSRGFSLIFEGKPDDARPLFVRARELFVRARGADYNRIVVADYGEGGADLAAGKLAEALALYERARDLARGIAGEASLAYISATDNIANALTLLGRTDEALAIFAANDRASKPSSWRAAQTALALRVRKQFGDALAHDREAQKLTLAENQKGRRASYAPLGVGLDLLGLGRAREALPPLEEALALSADSPPDELAPVELAVARALRATGGDPLRAHDLATAARTRLAPLADRYASIYADQLREIDAFLAGR